jgi:uncharacterized protein (UPF0332 family)
MTHAENKVQWCLNKATKEGRKHRGLRKVKPDLHQVDDHMKKAEHDLEAMEHLVRGGFHDWAISAAFYAHYHCLLATLQKFGYESRNQECTFAAIELLIEQGKIRMSKDELLKIYAANMEDTAILGLRERFQYGTETLMEESKIQEILEQTKRFIERTKVVLQT